jgi:hypothetical protein
MPPLGASQEAKRSRDRMVEPPQTGAEGCAIEVHEKSRGISRDFQIGDHLRETDGLQVET